MKTMAEKKTSSVTEPDERLVVITRIFGAPRELVSKELEGESSTLIAAALEVHAG